jgi:hypothetical protein
MNPLLNRSGFFISIIRGSRREPALTFLKIIQIRRSKRQFAQTFPFRTKMIELTFDATKKS